MRKVFILFYYILFYYIIFCFYYISRSYAPYWVVAAAVVTSMQRTTTDPSRRRCWRTRRFASLQRRPSCSTAVHLAFLRRGQDPWWGLLSKNVRWTWNRKEANKLLCFPFLKHLIKCSHRTTQLPFPSGSKVCSEKRSRSKRVEKVWFHHQN